MHKGQELKEPVFLKQKEVLLSLGLLVRIHTTPSLAPSPDTSRRISEVVPEDLP